MTTFESSRDILAHPEEIFDALSNPERLARWWGPSGFSNTFHQFQFTPGGKWSLVMHGPDGRNYSNENEFVEIVPMKRVIIRHLSKPNYMLTIIITSISHGSTVQWIQEFDNDEVAKNIAHIVEPGNEQNLDRLVAEVCAK